MLFVMKNKNKYRRERRNIKGGINKYSRGVRKEEGFFFAYWKSAESKPAGKENEKRTGKTNKTEFIS